MKRRAENPFIRSEGLLIAAALGFALVFCLAVCLCRQPDAIALRPVHAVSGEALRRAEMVNLNRAGVQELTQLPGIGEELAARIVEYRAANGPFQSLEELVNVPGIGEGRLAAVHEQVYLE